MTSALKVISRENVSAIGDCSNCQRKISILIEVDAGVFVCACHEPSLTRALAEPLSNSDGDRSHPIATAAAPPPSPVAAVATHSVSPVMATSEVVAADVPAAASRFDMPECPAFLLRPNQNTTSTVSA